MEANGLSKLLDNPSVGMGKMPTWLRNSTTKEVVDIAYYLKKIVLDHASFQFGFW